MRILSFKIQNKTTLWGFQFANRLTSNDLHSTLDIYKHRQTGIHHYFKLLSLEGLKLRNFFLSLPIVPALQLNMLSGLTVTSTDSSWALASFPCSVRSSWFHLLFCSSLNCTISQCHCFSCGLTSTFRFLTLLTLLYTNPPVLNTSRYRSPCFLTCQERLWKFI